MPRPTDTEPAPDRDPLDLVAEDFARRCREGEHPSVEDYAATHPELADELRRLLPAVAFLERGKRGSGRSGSSSRHRLGLAAWSVGEPPAPERLGENRIVRELGRGGMGIVYEAVQEPLGRRVALKVLPSHAQARVQARERFLREAQAVARLRHPHIVPIHAVGEEGGLPYYVMALVDGKGLDQHLEHGSPVLPADPVERARWVARLGRQAAEALAYAHGQGVLHRDIKPSNLLLDASGTLWLADFGLAKLADDHSLTTTGDLPGTLRYLAPECLRAEADARSDVYSLGLTLYELVAGRPAFPEQDRVRLLHQIESHRAVPAPRQLVPALPRDLETIVLKAMAHDPSARYTTAAALADDLGRFLDGRPILARRSSAAERLVRWGRRNPLVAGLAGSSIVLGLIAAYFFRLYWIAPRPPRPDRPPPGFFGPPPPEYDRPPPPPPGRRPFDRPGPPPPRGERGR